MALQPWSAQAINLADHADNPIHTDEGAQAAGFKAAIVAGTTIYAYMTRPPATAWGEQWLTQGGGELRLRLPVLDGEQVDCLVDESTSTVTAAVNDETRATFELWATADAPPMRTGDPLPTAEFVLDQSQAEYGARAGDDSTLYNELTTSGSGLVAHPAIWPSLANGVFSAHLISGAWVHTRSRLFHQGLAHVGDEMTIQSTVIDRFESRSGKRAVVDMQITANGQPVARIEHEAIVEMAS